MNTAISSNHCLWCKIVMKVDGGLRWLGQQVSKLGHWEEVGQKDRVPMKLVKKEMNRIKEDWNKVKDFKYGCGHHGKLIVLDCNELSTMYYGEWLVTTGYEGDKSECFECYTYRVQTERMLDDYVVLGRDCLGS